jgi:hypothetical protein
MLPGSGDTLRDLVEMTACEMWLRCGKKDLLKAAIEVPPQFLK